MAMAFIVGLDGHLLGIIIECKLVEKAVAVKSIRTFGASAGYRTIQVIEIAAGVIIASPRVNRVT